MTAPVQRVPDFLAGHLSTGALPSSSYRWARFFTAAMPKVSEPVCTAACPTMLKILTIVHFVASCGLSVIISPQQGGTCDAC